MNLSFYVDENVPSFLSRNTFSRKLQYTYLCSIPLDLTVAVRRLLCVLIEALEVDRMKLVDGGLSDPVVIELER